MGNIIIMHNTFRHRSRAWTPRNCESFPFLLNVAVLCNTFVVEFQSNVIKTAVKCFFGHCYLLQFTSDVTLMLYCCLRDTPP